MHDGTTSMLAHRWSDEAAEMQQGPLRSGPPPTDGQDKESINTDSDKPYPANQPHATLHSKPLTGTDAQDKESLNSRESLQSKPPSIVDTQEKDPSLQSHNSSILNTQDKEPLQSK